MRVTVVPGRSSASMTRFIAALPLFVGSLAIAVLNLGFLGAVIAMLIGVPGLLLVLVAVVRLSTRRASKRAANRGQVFNAPASVDGVAGVLMAQPGVLEWRPRRGHHPTVAYAVDDIDQVSITPVNALLLNVARINVIGRDGRCTRMTVTARPDTIRAALESLA